MSDRAVRPLFPTATDSVSDDELLRVWQLFRHTVASVDSRLNAGVDDPASAIPRLTTEALLHLAAHHDRKLQMGRLATALGLTTGAVTKLVDRLVDAGYATREYGVADRRVVLCVLTDAGLCAAQTARPFYVHRLREQFSTLGERRVSQLVSACEAILEVTTPPATASA